MLAAAPTRGGARRRLLAVLGGAAVIGALVAQRRSLLAAAARVGKASLLLLGLALACEVVSLLAAAELQRRLLRSGGTQLPLRKLLALAWASNAVGASLPAGAAASTAYTYRLLTRRGTPASLAGWVLASTGILSGASLGLLAVVGLQLRGFLSGCTLADVVELAGLTGAAVVSVALLAWVSAAPERVRAAERLVRHAVATISTVVPRGASRRPRLGQPAGMAAPVALRSGQWIGALVLAATNWVADGAVLAVSLLASGASVPLRGLAFAYTVSQLSTIAPILPGAIGVAEGSLVLALVCIGVKPDDALVATLLYRLASFWLQLVPGWVAWAYLRQLEVVPSAAAATGTALPLIPRSRRGHARS